MIGSFLLSGLLLAVADTTGGAAAPDSSANRPHERPRLVTTLRVQRVEGERLGSSARMRMPTAFVAEVRTGSSGRALETLSEVLGELAGVRITQYGGLGSFSTVSLRGAPAGQVSVFLDGAPMTSAAHGVINLADLPITAIERIEVYRGFSPLGLGVATPGGAINLVTVSALDRVQARVVRGAFDTWEARVTGNAQRGPFSALVHGGYQGSTGRFSYPDDNGTPVERGDDSASIRINNRFDAATLLGTVTFIPISGLRVVAREDLFHKAQGMPGLGATPARHPRLSFQRSITQLDLERDSAGWQPSMRLHGAFQGEWSRLRDELGGLGLGRHRTHDAFRGEDLAADLAWPRIGPLALHGGVALRSERGKLHDDLDGLPDPPPSRRRTESATAGLELSPLRDLMLVHAARRWDRMRDHLRSIGVASIEQRTDLTRILDTPQLGIRLTPGAGVELRANWTDAARAPDFLELFGNQGSILGNPSLVPERGENWDAGLTWQHAWGPGDPGPLRRVGLEWAHFDSRARDLIVYVRNSQSSVRAVNVSRSRVYGDELSVRLTARGGVACSGSATWQSATDRGPLARYRGKWLPQRPARQGYARLEWRGAALGAAVDVQHIGLNYLNQYNSDRVQPRTLAGASLSLSPAAGLLRLVVEGKNLGNDHAFDVGGFPLPGRSWFVSVDYGLGGPPKDSFK